MQNEKSRFYFLVFLFLQVSCHLFNRSFAQSSINSPYSRYGIGDIHSSGFVQNSAIANTGIAIQNDSTTPFFINNINPASYTSFGITVFEAGLRSNTYQQQTISSSQIKNSTSLGYIAFGLPVKKWWGLSFGLLPYSNVGYKITDQQTLDSIGTVNYIYEGTGGVNKMYLGNGIKINNFSVGANASYIFGVLNHSKKDVFSAPGYLNTRINKSTSISDLYLDYGAQYTFKIDSIRKKTAQKVDSVRVVKKTKHDIEDVRVTLGATFALQSDINAKSSTLAETYLLNTFANTETVFDTVQNTVDKEGFIKLPMSFGAGLAIKKGYRWMVAADYFTQKWSDFSAFGVNQGLKNSSKISLGAKYAPGTTSGSQTDYWKKVQYLIGVKYYQTHLELDNNQLSERSVSFGFGLPVGRLKALQQYSMVNFSLELGYRGTINNNLIKEQFARATVGFTLNDRWFIKPKID